MSRVDAAVRLAAFALIATAGADAQAWVPQKGEGSLSATYSFLASNGHYTTEGKKVAEAAAQSQSSIVEVEYGLTERLALNASLAFVSIRYNSNNPPTAVLRTLFDQTLQTTGKQFYNHGFLDDGAWHSSVQDIQVNVRYNLVSRPLLITPFVGFTLPSHDYAYVGESAPGRNLREFNFGVSAGRKLDPFAEKMYLHSTIEFAIPQAALGVRTTRTNLFLETGYAVTRRLSLRGFGNYQHTFNGLRFPVDLTTPEISLTHERLLKANWWHVGGGVSYALTPKTEIAADVVSFVAGSDTHYGTGVSLRITRSFQRRGHAKSSTFNTQTVF
jgi:hypothetical protein